jgi:hypothetical protein
MLLGLRYCGGSFFWVRGLGCCLFVELNEFFMPLALFVCCIFLYVSYYFNKRCEQTTFVLSSFF